MISFWMRDESKRIADALKQSHLVGGESSVIDSEFRGGPEVKRVTHTTGYVTLNISCRRVAAPPPSQIEGRGK